jgi:hypothetical protein
MNADKTRLVGRPILAAAALSGGFWRQSAYGGIAVTEKKPMKTVFLSSTALGLEKYRDAVYAAIQKLDGYKCVRMEDFGARELESAEFCAARAADCDVFVALVGQRYGSNPPDDPRSFTEIEFDAAKSGGAKLLIFAAPEEFAVPANLIESDDKRRRLKAFRDRLLRQPAPSFTDELTLAVLVIQALHNLRDRSLESGELLLAEEQKTYLLFPWVTQGSGFDTGLAICNAGSDPLGTHGHPGACIFHYFGTMGDGSPAPPPQASALVTPGSVCTSTLYNGSAQWLLDNRGAGFSGYIIVECNFPDAHGYAHIGRLGAASDAIGPSSGYLATVIKPGQKRANSG